jgi:hypothetical protein
MRATSIKFTAIACLHCLVGVLMYRGRVVGKVPFLESDFLVFALPALLAAIGYGIAYWSTGALHTRLVARLMSLVGISVVATGLSFWVFMLIAFNKYGT